MSFYSCGERIAGDFYTFPAAVNSSLPAVVLSQGWGGVKERILGEFAHRLVARRFLALAFDYRGYGQSEGRKNRLFPLEQAEDIRAAVAYLRSTRVVDPARIAVLSMLTGAAAALHAASFDPAIAAVVGLYAFGDGGRWLQSLRSHWQWREFVHRIDADRVSRSNAGASEMLDPNEILIRDPEGVRSEERLRAASIERREWRLGLDSADAIMAFRPEEQVQRIAPRPVMLVAVEDDSMMPLAEVQRVYARLSEPRRMLILRDISHHQVYEPRILDSVVAEIAAFLDESMRTTF